MQHEQENYILYHLKRIEKKSSDETAVLESLMKLAKLPVMPQVLEDCGAHNFILTLSQQGGRAGPRAHDLYAKWLGLLEAHQRRTSAQRVQSPQHKPHTPGKSHHRTWHARNGEVPRPHHRRALNFNNTASGSTEPPGVPDRLHGHLSDDRRLARIPPVTNDKSHSCTHATLERCHRDTEKHRGNVEYQLSQRHRPGEHRRPDYRYHWSRSRPEEREASAQEGAPDAVKAENGSSLNLGEFNPNLSIDHSPEGGQSTAFSNSSSTVQEPYHVEMKAGMFHAIKNETAKPLSAHHREMCRFLRAKYGLYSSRIASHQYSGSDNSDDDGKPSTAASPVKSLQKPTICDKKTNIDIEKLKTLCTHYLTKNQELFVSLLQRCTVEPAAVHCVLERLPSLQLHRAEAACPALLEHTWRLWQVHCARDFGRVTPGQTMHWRVLYWKLYKEQKGRLKDAERTMTAKTGDDNLKRRTICK